MTDRGLGRLSAPDERDKNFPMRSLLSAPLKGSRFWWAGGWWGDQGSTSQCVEYSWHHWLCDGPVTQAKGPLWTPGDVYRVAQTIDEWDGEGYDGTSVRAGAKVLQQRGFIESYHWAFDAATVARAVLEVGPVVVGTNWYSSMFHPNAAGLIKVDGANAGGHAYLLDGVNADREYFRIKNSWGRSWGRKGFALISFADMDRLIREDGEACIAVEKKK